MVTSKTLTRGYLIYPFFLFLVFFASRTLSQLCVFLAVKKRRQDDPMTTRIVFGIKLRPLMTEFWREKIRPDFFQDILIRTPVNG